uniref:Potassium voltage-gated channel protein eag n=1 Tax=Globodera rostochiensis TaxID=31243 RepID=A0A914H3V1_GLORO
MVVARRGLVAPQNTFLEAVVRRCNNTDSSFILANAQIIDYPIVYCNEGFSRLIGYTRAEIMQKNASLSFMYGEHTDQTSIQKIQNSMETEKTEQVEIGLSKKNKFVLWLLMNISPIKNDANRVVLYLCQFKDITPLKEPFEGENNKILGLSRILQIARVAKYRQQFTPNNIETKDLLKSRAYPGLQSSNFQQQLMNLGGDVLPQYREETPKTSPHIILHYSTSKTVWDWSILALTFYTAFMVPFNIAFRPRDPLPLGIDYVVLLDSIVDVIFFADILLNFHTTFVGPVGEVVIDPQAIRKNYFKSWFLIDLLSCLPYDIFYMFKQDDERIASLFSALKVVRLLRLGRVARKLDNYLEYGAATLLLLLCAYVLARHKFYYADQPLAEGWLIRLSYDLKMPFNITSSTLNRLVGGPDRTQCYVSALYFTMSCMSTVGFGNIASTTMNEKIFGICMMMFSSISYAAIFGHMTTIIQQMTSSTQRYHQMISDVREFIKLQEVPNELAERVLDYITSTWAMNKGIDTAKVLSFCPKDMRADICVHMNRKVFNEHSCFKLASEGCQRAFATNLDTIHAAPGDLLYHTGESVDALWFLVQGSLEVIQDEEVVAILGKGDVFGDEFWRNTKTGQSTCIVRALTYSDLHFIKREHLLQVLNFYKAFSNSFARNLVLTYNLTNRLKFRKVLDVKRELELDERRKNEKLEIPGDHPIRKLLQRMHERHAVRLQSTRGADDSDEAFHSVQNETNTMMEDLQDKFKNIDGVFEKLSQIERLLGTLMSRQMEEAQYATIDTHSTSTFQQQQIIQQLSTVPHHSVSFDQYQQHHQQQPTSSNLYRSALRTNATSKYPTISNKMPSLSMDKPEIGDNKSGGIAPRIPPLRLNDETVPPSPGTASSSCVQMLNHHQQNYKHQQQQQQQRHQLFQQQQQRRLSSVERCPCCSNSPHQQHIPMAAPTQVPRILVESRGTELQQQHQHQRHFNRNGDGREEGTVAATEFETAGRHTPPPLMRRF